MIRSCTFIAISGMMFFETLCFFPRTKSFGSLCILYIPFADQFYFVSLFSTIEAKNRNKSMRENNYSSRQEKKFISFFLSECVERKSTSRKTGVTLFERFEMVQTCPGYFYSTLSGFLTFSAFIWCVVSILLRSKQFFLLCIFKGNSTVLIQVQFSLIK